MLSRGTFTEWQTAMSTPASSMSSTICSAFVPLVSPVFVPSPRAAQPALYMASSIMSWPPQCSGFESQTCVSMIIRALPASHTSPYTRTPFAATV